jgi:hypothetical protein
MPCLESLNISALLEEKIVADNAPQKRDRPALTQQKNDWLLTRNKAAILTLVFMIFSVIPTALAFFMIPMVGMATVLDFAYLFLPIAGSTITLSGITALFAWIKSGLLQNKMERNSKKIERHSQHVPEFKADASYQSTELYLQKSLLVEMPKKTMQTSSVLASGHNLFPKAPSNNREIYENKEIRALCATIPSHQWARHEFTI